MRIGRNVEEQQGTLFSNSEITDTSSAVEQSYRSFGECLKRIDSDPELNQYLLQFCRIRQGQVWEDPVHGHRVAILDAANSRDMALLMGGEKANLAVNDPPYNIVVGGNGSKHLPKVSLEDYLQFSRNWVINSVASLKDNSHFYCWLGADYRDNFQPLPDFMILMREFANLKPRNFITLRNQRGYGTQYNWMWVRQELLHYTVGNPEFSVVYTDIPKVLRGYYKEVAGKLTENIERSKSDTIRPGNVWIDVQQVFYRMEENVPGCYAQKPLKAIERIVETSSKEHDVVVDSFAHAGTTLLAGERLNRRVLTCDVNPVFAELTIRRLEHFRMTGKTGWQMHNPFPEMDSFQGR